MVTGNLNESLTCGIVIDKEHIFNKSYRTIMCFEILNTNEIVFYVGDMKNII